MSEQIQDTGTKKKRRDLCERFLMSDSQEGLHTPTREVILVREPASEGDEISLIDLWKVIQKSWILILIPSIIIALLIGIHSYTRPRFYVAQTTIVPPIESMQGSSSLGSLLGGIQGSVFSRMTGRTNLMDMYVGILESRSIAEKIIDRFDLKKAYGDASLEKAFRILSRKSSFKVRDDGMLSIEVRDLDPHRASDMANAFAEELDRENQRLSSGSVTSKRKFLEGRLAELRQELGSIEEITSQEAAIKEMIFEMLSQEYELARIDEAKSMPTIQVLDAAIPPETSLDKGAVKKGLMTFFALFMFGMFLAFAREYVIFFQTSRNHCFMDPKEK